MQKSLSAYNQPFIPSSSPSPSSTTINQLANMFQLGNSLTTTTTNTTTTTTSKTDSENRVIFADPSSNCGTKNRSVSPIHQNQDFFFSPTKRLFIQSPPPPSITMIPPFQANSVSQKQSILSSPSSSLPSSIENNWNNAIAPKSPVSSIKLDSFAKSPENRPSVSQPVAYLGQLGSFSASSGSTAEESPASASRSPRPPKLFRSIADPLSTSSPGTKILSLPDQKGWEILNDCLAALNQLVNDSTQKEEAEDHKDDNENKHVSESDGEENADTEENPVGMFKCSCGKRSVKYEATKLSSPSSIENNKNNATAPKSPVSSIKLDSFARLPENRPSDSQPASYLGQLGSFSAASGSTAEGSPGPASRTPPDPLLTSSPETKKGWDILNDCLAALNQLVNDSTQKEEAEDHKDDNENKHVSENNGEENEETEGNPVDMFKCSCGKRCIQIFVKTLVRTITLMVKCSDTVAYVKRKIEEKEGIPEVHQSLLFSGMELVEGRTLADYNVRNFATLQLELRVCGGSPYCLFCPKKRFETHVDVLRHLMNHKKVDENKEMEAQKKQKDWKKKSVRHGKAPGEKKKEGEKKKKKTK